MQLNLFEEIWRPIIGYEELYEVSNFGRVRSLDKRVRMISRSGNESFRIVKGKVLTPQVRKDGYVMIVLYRDTKPEGKLIHHLVYEAFVDLYIKGLVVDHIDKDRANNRLDNIQQITQRKNVIRSVNKDRKTSKYTGVRKRFNQGYDRPIYQANISINGTPTYLGSFATEEAAHNAYLKELKRINDAEG